MLLILSYAKEMSLKDVITAAMIFVNYFLKISLKISDEKTVVKNNLCSF